MCKLEAYPDCPDVLEFQWAFWPIIFPLFQGTLTCDSAAVSIEDSSLVGGMSLWQLISKIQGITFRGQLQPLVNGRYLAVS